MSIAGAQACSFFDDDPTSPTYGVVVQFNRITENSSFYSKGVGEKDFRGNMIYAGDESRLEIEAFDYEGKVTQLKEWQKNKTPLKFVLAGVQENILWYEETTIEIEEPKSFATKTRNAIKVRMEADGGEHKIWSGINLLDGAVKLSGFVEGWADIDSNGLANGFSVTNISSNTFNHSSKIQTLTNATTSSYYISKKILFPISGIKLTFSQSVVSKYPGGTGVSVFFRDSLAVLISQSSLYNSNLGRQKLNQTSPSGLFNLEMVIGFGQADTIGNQCQISFPSLRTDNSDEYIAG